MSTEYGTIITVDIVPSGSDLSADAASGATVLNVSMAYDFNEAGGSLDLNGTILAYTKADPSTDTITMAAPIPTAAVAGDKVLVYPYGQYKQAMVYCDDNDEPIFALVGFSHTAALDEGIRDEADQEQVLISDDRGRWEVVALDEEIPTYDGSYVDPTTLPPPDLTPTAPPATSPTLTPTGTLDSVILRATDVEASTSIKYYLGTSAGFTADATTLLPGTPTRSTVYVANKKPDGNALALNTDYYFKAIATNVVGDGPVGTEVGPVQLDPTKASAVVADEVVSGFTLTGRIQVGISYWDANDGLVMPQPDGSTIVLPVDGVTPAQITAYLIARSLTIDDNLVIQGTGRITGSMTIASGITNPTVKPTITQQWPFMDTFLDDGNRSNYGLVEHSSTQWATAVSALGAQIALINKSDGSSPGTYPTVGKPWSPNFFPTGGLTKIGTNYYILGTDNSRSGWYLYKIDSSWNKVSEYGPAAFAHPPSVGNDGTNPMICWVNSSNDVQLRRINNSTMASIGTDTVETAPSIPVGSTDPYSIFYVGEGLLGDPSASRLYIQSIYSAYMSTNGDVRCFLDNGVGGYTRDSGRDFPPAGDVRGMCYDTAEASMISMTKGGIIYRYGKYTMKQDYTAAYTWYDGNSTGGTHETMISTPATVNLKPRAQIKIEAPPAPDINDVDPTHTDKADRIGIYAGAGTAPPVKLQSLLAAGTRSLTIRDTFATTTAPPGSNGFIGAVSGATGRFMSATARSASGLPKTDITGDGLGRMDAVMPCGAIIMYSALVAPVGFLICDGSSFSSVTYPDLAALLGDRFGIHIGTTYWLPDMRRRFPFGWMPGAGDNLAGQDVGAYETSNGLSGTQAYAGDASRMEHSHSHTVQDHHHSISGASGSGGVQKGSGSSTPTVTTYGDFNGHGHGGSTGDANPDTNARGLGDANTDYHAHLTLNFLIKT